MAVKVRGVSDRSKLRWFLLLAALLSALVESHPADGQTVETSKQTNEKIQRLASRARVQPTDIPIGAGDLLHIDVFDVPELSRDVRVSDTGDISFPLIPGRIRVAGSSAFQFENQLAQLLLENGLVSHPQVSVFVKEQTSQPISIVGAVQHPMVYQVLRPTTLLQVLSDAGGIADDAGAEIIITRPTADGQQTTAPDQPPPGDGSHSDPPGEAPAQAPEVITVKIEDLLNSGSSQFDVPVHGGDTIRVPKAGIIYVLGAGVAAPGGYVLQGHGEDVTALKVLALAHGLTGFAKADSSVLMRNNPAGGKREVIPVKLKQIQKHKVNDVVVQSNDILYIPDSVGKKALARGGEAAIGIGTSVSVYRVAYQ